MAKSINTFRVNNRTILTVSGISTNKTPVSMCEMQGGILRIDISRMSPAASKSTVIKNFPMDCRIINAWANCITGGGASHALRLAKYASTASNILNVPVLSAASGFRFANRLYHSRAKITAGDNLLLVGSGSTISAMRGTLFVQVLPL
jgi:hypothetical protein